MNEKLTLVHDDVDNSEAIVRQMTLARFKPSDAIAPAVEAILKTAWWRNAEMCKDGGTVHILNRSVSDRCLFCGRAFFFEDEP